MKLKISAVGAALFFAASLAPASASDSAVMEAASSIKVLNLGDKSRAWYNTLRGAEWTCGATKGGVSTQRSQVLAEKYDALAAAVASGDADSVVEKAARLRETINQSELTSRCWKALARKAHIRQADQTLDSILAAAD